MSDLFDYNILGIHAPVFVGIVLAAVVGFVFLRLLGLRRESGMWLALAVLCLVLSGRSNEKFYSPSNVVNLVRLISYLGIFAVGLTFVIVTGGIDLSVGSVIGLTGVLIAKQVLAATTETEVAPLSHMLGVGLGLGLLAALMAAWALADRYRTAAALTLAGYAVLALGCVGLSYSDAGTGVAAVDAGLSTLGSLGGAGGAGPFNAAARAAVLGLGLLLAAFGLRFRGAFGWAVAVLVGYHFYALLDLSFTGGLPLWLAILVALAASTAVGLAQGLLLTKLNLQPFIVTLGVMLLIRGVSQVIVEGGTLSIQNEALKTLDRGGLFYQTTQTPQGPFTYPLLPYPVLIFLAVLAAAGYALHFTVFGRYVYAIGGNRDAAEYSGLPVKRVETATYAISAFLGGVAGVCFAAYIGQMSQQVGIAYELLAIAACVLGGCSLRGGEGTIVGVVIGTAVMRVIENGIIMFQWPYKDAAGNDKIWTLSSDYTFIIFGAVILVAIVLDQVAHILQAKRRTRTVTPAPPPKPPEPAGGFEVVQPSKALS
ncbi:MAG TPA: ABC transporter permease [Humisphaera sp.]